MLQPSQLEAMQNIGKASQNRSVHEFEKVSWFVCVCVCVCVCYPMKSVPATPSTPPPGSC